MFNETSRRWTRPKSGTPTDTGKTPAPKKEKIFSVSKMSDRISTLRSGPITPADVESLASDLQTMTVKEITEVKKRLGLKASGLKAEFARKVAERALSVASVAEQKKPDQNPEQQKAQKTKPGERFLPGKPIAERIAAYTDVDDIAASLGSLKKELDATYAEFRAARDQYDSSILEGNKILTQIEEAKQSKNKEEVKRLRAVFLKQNKETQKRSAERQRIGDENAAKQSEIRQKMRGLLKVPNPSSFKVGVVGMSSRPLTDKQRERTKAAFDFVNSITSKEASRSKILGDPVNVLSLPSGESRAYYDQASNSGTINMGEHDGVDIYAHELGHHVEYVMPGLSEAVGEFLAHRCGNEQPSSLKDLFPSSGYESHEMGRKDKFGNLWGDKSSRAYYAGKTYGTRSSEIVSLGVQTLYEDPAGFAERDPEYFKFIVGALRGNLT